MSTSDTLSELDALLALSQQLQAQAGVSLPWPFSDLLNLISSLVQKLLNTAIGQDGKTIKDIIDDLGDGITSTINGVSGAVTSARNTIVNTINGVIGQAGTTLSGVRDSITGAIGSAVTSIGNTVGGVITSVGGKIDGAVGSIGRTIGGAVSSITGYIDTTLGGLGQAFRDAIASLVNKVGEVIDAIKGIATSIAQSIGQAIGAIADNIASALQDAIIAVAGFIDSVIQGFKDAVGGIIKGIGDAIHAVIDTVGGWINSAYNAVKSAIESVVNTLKDTYESVKGTITDWLNRLLTWLREQIGEFTKVFQGMLVNAATWISQNFMPAWGKAVDWAQKISGLSPSVLEDLKRGDFSSLMAGIDNIFEAGAQAAVHSPLFALATAVAYFWEEVRLQFVPAELSAQMRARINLALDPISMDVAANGVYRGLWGEKEYLNNAALAGVAPSRAKVNLETGRPLPTPGQVQQLFLRGEISEKEHDNLLGDYGFSNQHIQEIKSLYMVIPGVADIITMAVREAFTPEIAQRFGQYQDLPQAFVDWAKKQGLSEDWSSRYWAAHWQLPSPQMGFEMFQRRIIEHDDLSLLLKALDVMPFWREKLIQLSYNPLTRVDVRRMYKVGVLDEEGVYNAYLDDGYSPERARQLTEFTKLYSPPEDQTQQDTFKALAQSTYNQAFIKNIISEDEYRTFLKTLGYAPDDAELLISIANYNKHTAGKLFDLDKYRSDWVKVIMNAYDRGLLTQTDTMEMLVNLGYEQGEAQSEIYLIDYNRQLALRNTLLAQLHDQYIGYTIDVSELANILNQFNFMADEIDKIQQEWDIERSFRTRKPSLADFRKFFSQGLLSLDQLVNEIRGLGYPDKYVQMYVDSLTASGG